MSRLDAITQYENALKARKKYYNNALSKARLPSKYYENSVVIVKNFQN